MLLQKVGTDLFREMIHPDVIKGEWSDGESIILTKYAEEYHRMFMHHMLSEEDGMLLFLDSA